VRNPFCAEAGSRSLFEKALYLGFKSDNCTPGNCAMLVRRGVTV
jgi:hypothetical protein